MRIRCTKMTRIEVEPGKFAELDAHHEYYLDDDKARALIADGKAYELDANGRRVEPRSAAKKTAARKPPEQTPSGPAGKPASKRVTKAVKPPENKTTEPGPADEEKD